MQLLPMGKPSLYCDTRTIQLDVSFFTSRRCCLHQMALPEEAFPQVDCSVDLEIVSASPDHPANPHSSQQMMFYVHLCL